MTFSQSFSFSHLQQRKWKDGKAIILHWLTLNSSYRGETWSYAYTEISNQPFIHSNVILAIDRMKKQKNGSIDFFSSFRLIYK